MKRSAIALVLVLGIGAAIGVAAGGGPPKTTVHSVGWFDNFGDAQRQAKAEGKPILFLSMFGKLDEAMPCANARTLRATLFKDPEFRKLVTNDVVPAWEMVRAVPKVTFDLGDGNPIKRTVRGNAVMYLCNPDGKVIDAYPGIYTKKDFIPMVKESIAKLAKATDAEAIAYHKSFPANRIAFIDSTLSKSVAESPTLDMIGARAIRGAVSKPEPNVTVERQRFLRAARQVRDASLTPRSAGEVVMAVTGREIGDIPATDLASEILAKDSKTNVGPVRSVIHLWLASEKHLPTPKEARDTVLETILKIPYKDPYFGLKDVLLPGTPE